MFFGVELCRFFLDINSLQDILFANIFYAVGCLLVLLIVSFVVQKLILGCLVAQLAKHLTLDFGSGHDLTKIESSSELTTRCLLRILSPSLSAPP